MIKTLQISSILAVVMAGVLFVSSIVFGSHQDKEIEAFLESPGAREQFQAAGNTAKPSKNQRSPLVEKAEQFAKIIGPPPPPKKTEAKKTAIEMVERIAQEPEEIFTAKFKLFGTVVCEANPESSLALIYEMGKGMQMVRQGSEIMHTTIEKIMDGKIVVRNSKGTVEMVVEEDPASASVVAGTPRAGMPSRTRSVPPSSRKRITSKPTRTSSTVRRPPVKTDIRSQITKKEKDRLAAIENRLKAAKEAEAKKNAKTATSGRSRSPVTPPSPRR